MHIVYNHKCSKCRATRELLEAEGYSPRLRHYLDDPLTDAELRRVATKVGGAPHDILRAKEPAYVANQLDGAPLEAVCASAVEHPALINRPIVIWGKKAIVARPPERVFELIPRGPFVHREATIEELDELIRNEIIKGTGLEYAMLRGVSAEASLITGTFGPLPGAKAIDEANACVSATYFASTLDEAELDARAHADVPVYRVRATASHPAVRGLGLGRGLLDFGAGELLKRADAPELWLWCNARHTARPFYERMGWEAFGDSFKIGSIGRHYKMRKRVVA